MKKLLIAICLCFVMTASISTPKVNGVGKYIKYYMDERTGLCFAAINTEFSFFSPFNTHSSIATVPCDKVKNYLK